MSQPLIATLLCAAMLVATQGAPDPRREVHEYLARSGFSGQQIGAFDAGEIVARAAIADSQEIIVVAAVKIRAPRDRVLDYYGQMISYVDGSVTRAFGRFSTPPAARDVASLSFDREDIDALRSCTPGKCDVKLGGTAIESLRQSIDWRAPDAADRVNAFARKAAVDYVAAYQARGNAALVTYDDRKKPVSLQEQWRGILSGSTYFHEYAPELRAYLERYPAGRMPGARDIFYWVTEDYGYKPVISIVHGVLYQPPARPDRAFVAQKQLYASHYFEGSLALATLLSVTESGAPATYLVYANRSRGDMLRGGFGLKRGMAESQARKAAEETLATVKRQMER